jgi:hypothetical protein
MDFFWVEFFCYGGIVGNICKENRDELALSLNRTASGQDFISKEFGS